MPNNCYFEMKVAGKEEAVEKFVQMIKREGPFEEYGGLGRVFSFDVDHSLTEKDPSGAYIAVTAQGDCANSLRTALVEWPYRPLGITAANLGVVLEAYSSEPGCFFQEHLLVDQKGDVSLECVHYEEYFIEGASEKEIESVCEEKEISREELISKLNSNGEYCIGGFEDFGVFQNLFPMLDRQQPSLDEKVQNAEASLKQRSPEEPCKPAPQQERDSL